LELGDELADGLGIILGVEVNDESVDHVCGLRQCGLREVAKVECLQDDVRRALEVM